MIANSSEYRSAEEELRTMEQRLARLQRDRAVASKGFTEAGVQKMVARLRKELADYEESEETPQPNPE